jgi:opacity protein-like surface antigen
MSRFLTALALGLALIPGAAAATLQQLNLTQLTQAATAIVRARVTGASASFTGSTIYTHYQLQVTESWKGFTPTEVAVPGGVAGGYRQSFPGMPQLTVGTEYVMFLWTSKSTGITHLVGLSQGLFDLSAQSDGSTLATRPLIGEMMLDASGHKVADQPVRMSVSSLKAQVRTNLAGAQ